MNILFFPLFLLLSISTAVYAQVTEGRVVGISDGDTIRLLVGKSQIKVRLAEIDAPESGQPWGEKSRQALADKISGKDVRVRWQQQDRYGRIIGTVFLGERNINQELIREGHAWVYRQYLLDKGLTLIEEEARKAGSGLWSLSENERQAPWQWRKKVRNVQSESVAAKKPSESYSCRGKLYCRQMTSCMEARFYLEKCGLHRLDVDKDGIPCEKLCR